MRLGVSLMHYLLSRYLADEAVHLAAQVARPAMQRLRGGDLLSGQALVYRRGGDVLHIAGGIPLKRP